MGFMLSISGFTTKGQNIDIPIQIEMTVTSNYIRIYLTDPSASWAQASRAYAYRDNGEIKWGRELIPNMVGIYSEEQTVNRYLNEIFPAISKVTHNDLVASGDALNISWETAKGSEELQVTIFAFVSKFATNMGFNASNVYSEILLSLE